MPGRQSTHNAGASDELVHVTKQVCSALSELHRHLSFLWTELDSELHHGPITYLIDWDVIQMFAEYRLSRSVHAAAAIAGFSAAHKANIRLVVPQGTRMEFAAYVSRKLVRTPGIDSKVFDEARELQREGLFKDRAYDAPHAEILRCQYISGIAALLDKFGNKYARSISTLSDSSFYTGPLRDLQRTKEYINAYEEIRARRPDGRRRNIADAANLAILDVAATHNKDCRLVTGTRLLYELRPRLVIDPITLLFRFHAVASTRGKLRAAQESIADARNRVSALLTQSKVVGRGVQSTGTFITRSQAHGWIEHFRELEDDEILGDLVRVISGAQMDANMRLSLESERRALEHLRTPLTGFREIRTATSHLGAALASMYGTEDPLEDLQYTWQEARRVGTTSVVELLHRRSDTVLRIGVSPTFVVCTWHAGLELAEFLSLISELLAEKRLYLSRVSVLKVYYRDRPSRHFGLSKKGIRAASRWGSRLRPDAIRVFCKGVQFVYTAVDEGNMNAASITVIADHDVSEHAIGFLGETSSRFLPVNSIIKKIRELAKAV